MSRGYLISSSLWLAVIIRGYSVNYKVHNSHPDLRQ